MLTVKHIEGGLPLRSSRVFHTGSQEHAYEDTQQINVALLAAATCKHTAASFS